MLMGPIAHAQPPIRHACRQRRLVAAYDLITHAPSPPVPAKHPAAAINGHHTTRGDEDEDDMTQGE